MPRKWKQSDYDDDGYDYDEVDCYDNDDFTHHKPTSTSGMPQGNSRNSSCFQQPAAAPVDESETEGGFWSCPVCTFDNSLDSMTCVICDTSREESSEEVSGTSVSSKATDVPSILPISPLAKALFKSLPGTKSDKQMTGAFFRSDTTVSNQNPWVELWDSSSLSSKIVPFKFDTPSPDEKSRAACGLKEPLRIGQCPDNVLTGARGSMARAGDLNPAASAEGTGSNPSLNQVQPSVCNSLVGNASSSRVSSIPNKLADKLRGLTIESYIPESWMLQHSNKDSRQLLHLIVVGHVDAGKSTLMGRILHLLGQVTQKEMHKNEKESKQQGKGSFAYAFVLDEGAEERARGVTMRVAVAHFKTSKLRVVLLDAPGHKDFVPNMISGASQADSAILVVDASIGAFEAGLEGEGQGRGQTREHAQLVRSLGVEQLIVAVNKLDAVGFSKERFDDIKNTLQPFLRQCGFKDGYVQWVPVSAADNQNLTTTTTDPALKAWYDGPCLVELVDSLEPPRRLVSRPLRLVIAEVMRTRTLGPSAFGGKLESGAIRIGTMVRVMPSGVVATVKCIEQQGHHLALARAGEGVDVGLHGIDPGMLAPGGVVCHPDYPVPVAIRFEVRLLTLDISTPILKGSQVDLHVHHARLPARVDHLVSLLDPKKGIVLRQCPRRLTANQSAIVEIVPDEGVCIEKYIDFRVLGRVALREGGKTIAVGIVTRVLDTN
ncbi:hypothetical protein KC19_VG023400 [Ceratodon purpureus]|uniref:Uncharacterized protein n=1 Tax=Ceratodon purpureus TaxID=3225 RepID=A0A8T0HLB5_CERPU|nr:hypothetical protein KC19_VG023400 [Ceratodon purpureus]